MDWEAAILALATLAATIANQIMKDDNLTDEQKKSYIARIQVSMDGVPEWE